MHVFGVTCSRKLGQKVRTFFTFFIIIIFIHKEHMEH